MESPFTDFIPESKHVETYQDQLFETPLLDPETIEEATLDGVTSERIDHKTEDWLGIPTAVKLATTSRWHQLIPGTIPCPAIPLLHGKETFKSMVDAIKTATNTNHYIYILGWMLDAEFEMITGDKDSTLIKLLSQAAMNGVEIRILVWDNPYYYDEIKKAKSQINLWPNSQLCTDKATFGSAKVKDAIKRARAIMDEAPDVLSRIEAWKDIKEFINRVDNEGSHHEKVVIVKGNEGLIGFCGGIDINPNRIYKIDKNRKSEVLHDVHCQVRGHGAWSLLERFKERWEAFKESLTVYERFGYVWLAKELRGKNEPQPLPSSPSKYTAHVKILHTYNHPVNKNIRKRSIRETVRIAIANAKKSIHIEDQYMISLEIASWLNARLKDPGFKSVSILTQDDQFAKPDIMFPKVMRKKFIDQLCKGLSPDVIKQKVFIYMLHPDTPLMSHHKVHSKIYVIDDELAIIGSANCSSRSMTHDTETAAVIFNDPSSETNFVASLNSRMNYDPDKNLVRFVPNKDILDKDVEIKLALDKYQMYASAVNLPIIGMIPVGIKSLVPALKPILIDIIDPDADDTLLQQEIPATDYESYLDNEQAPDNENSFETLEHDIDNEFVESFYNNESLEINSPFINEEESLLVNEPGKLTSVPTDVVTAYSNMNLQQKGMSLDCFRIAMNGFRKLVRDGQVKNNKFLTIADFTQSSRKKRLYILDMVNQQVFLQTNVAHGSKSGPNKEWATRFSDTPGSNMSSLGFYVTLHTYTSKKNGLSLRLEGKESGFNANAKRRAIVVHGATYVKEDGNIIGRSWGCPAVAMELAPKVINTIKDGTCLFIYYNDQDYLTKSVFVNDEGASQSSPGFLSGIINKGKNILSGIASTFSSGDNIVRQWGSKEEMAKYIEQLTLKELPALSGKKPEQMSSTDKAKFNETWTRIRKKLFEQRRGLFASGTIPAIGGSKVPFGFRETTYHSIKGLRSDSNLLVSERLDKVLSGLHQQKKITITQDELDVLQRISNVETSGKIQTFNSYDRGIVSIGFMQFTIHVGKIQEWMKLAPNAFRRYGLELDQTEQYDFKENGKHQAIKSVPQSRLDDLRWNGWAERFYYAGLDDEVVAAEVKLALSYLQRHLKGLKSRLKNDVVYNSFVTNYYNKNKYVRGLFQASYNNNPSRSTTCIRDTFTLFTGVNPSIDEFIEKYKSVLKGKDWERLVNETANGTSITLTTAQNETEVDYSSYETDVETYETDVQAFEEEDTGDYYTNVSDTFETEVDEAEEVESFIESHESFDDEAEIAYEDLNEVEQETSEENFYEGLMTEMEEPAKTTAPALIEEDTSVPGYTCYVKIDIGKGNYPLDKTGIYVPASFNPSQPVDVVVYLHGMTGTFPGPTARINEYWSKTNLPAYDFRLREEVNASGKNIVLVAPSMGNSPNAYNNSLSGKKDGLDKYLEKVLNAINTYIVKNRFNSPEINFRNVILSAHSAGGRQMRMIATAENPVYGPTITECWGLDSLYSGVNTWISWAKKNPDKKLFIYYLNSTKNNSVSLANNSKKLSNVFVKQSSAKNHFLVPKEHLQERLKKLGKTDPTKTDFEDSDLLMEQEAANTETSSNTNTDCEGLICWAKGILKKESAISLPPGNALDDQTKKAISDFQAKENLTKTQKIDATTERALLESEAINRNKGTVKESDTVQIISDAKTKIEDWTKQTVNVNHKLLTNKYRDPRKIHALVLHHMAFKRRSPKTKQFSDPNSYLKTRAHFCIMLDGRIIQLHSFSRMIWHSNCTSPRSVGVEFEGNFPNIKGGWWIDKTSKVQNKDYPTQAQYDSGRFLINYLKIVLGTTHVLAHRQSSKDRVNDPGPDIWFNVGQWAIDNLGVTDGGPEFKCGDGNPILPQWRTWGAKTTPVINPEYSEMEEETEEIDEENESGYPDEEVQEVNYYEVDNHGESGESNTHDHEHALYETDELVKDLSKAVSLNREYATKLGWDQYRQQINDLVLPYSGYQDVSLGEEAFAEAVANWQLNQGFSSKDSDGIIGPNTWARMKSQIFSQAQPSPVVTVGSDAPSPQNIFEFNQWHAQKILDSINNRIIGVTDKTRNQLQRIVNGEQVFFVNPRQNIIKILPVIYHIAEQAGIEDHREIIIGSFIRDTNSTCGHCVGRCIDINHTSHDFSTRGSVEMVIRIFRYLLSLPSNYRKSMGFGLPMQGEFFGNQKLELFKGDKRSLLVNTQLKQLANQLGIVFPDNPNHLHIQVQWNLQEKELNEASYETVQKMEDEFNFEQEDVENYTPDFEEYSRAEKLNKMADWAYLLSFKVPEEIVAKLRKRNMQIQYAHDESYSNDLNVDFYRLKINKFPILSGVQLTPDSLIKYIRLNINSLIDTSYSDFYPYDSTIDKPVWSSDNPLGAVLKIDIKGPDNAAVVVSLSKPNGWRFSTVTTPDSGVHPVSGHREFFIGKDPVTKGTYFIIKGLDMASTGIAGLGLPFAGEWGFGQADKLWKSMREKIIKFINSNGGSAQSDITYSERVEWRYVYYRYKNLLEDTFGKGAGSAENSSFFDEISQQKA